MVARGPRGRCLSDLTRAPPIGLRLAVCGATRSDGKARSPRSSASAAFGRLDGRQRLGSWRKINVILPRQDLRERHHQRRQRNADNGLSGQAIRFQLPSGRRPHPPSPGLERVLHRDDQTVRASRLSRDLRQPVRAGGWRHSNPDDVAAKARAEGGIADAQMVGDTEGAHIKARLLSRRREPNPFRARG